MILDIGLTGDIAGEIFVGQEDHTVGAERFHDRDGIARGAADIGFGLHLSRGVHIGHHGNVG